MRRRSYLNSGFEVWNRQHTWFWSVVDARRNSGMIGAAATEAEAVSQARASIAERTAHSEAAQAPSMSDPVFRCSKSLAFCARG